MPQRLTFVLLVVCLLQPIRSFSSVKLCSRSCPVRTVRDTTATLRFSSNNDEPEPDEPMPVLPITDPVMAAMSSVPPPPPKRRQLDGLMAAVTRAAPSTAATQNVKTTNLPFFGEMPVDGSLLVLGPAAVIAVVGFVMSVVVAFNAKDTFVDQLAQLSDDINTAALVKTNQGSLDGSCRGLCSSQEQQLEGMRAFMEGISTKI
jgi:hypothetical protein